MKKVLLIIGVGAILALLIGLFVMPKQTEEKQLEVLDSIVNSVDTIAVDTLLIDSL